MKRNNSPYTAALTGCTFMFSEFQRVLPLLMSDDSDKLLKHEALNNEIMMVNSQTSRERFIVEFKRRYNAVPKTFWVRFNEMSEEGKKAGLLYAILKTYKLAFDFHFNVTLKKWNSMDIVVEKNDYFMELNEISSRDEFVDSWTELTKDKCVVNYLTILKQSGLLDEKTMKLKHILIESADYEYYIRTGEDWFLEACLLNPYEIKDIKSMLI